MNACLHVQARSTTVLIDKAPYNFHIFASNRPLQVKARLEELLAARWR